MRKPPQAIALTILSLIMTISCAVRSTAPIDEIIVFGDSLSDVGQVFQSSSGLYPPDPPYFQGRYSNGLVWVEYLAERLELEPPQMQNFAWGGAMTRSSSDSPVPGLRDQVERFIHAETSFNQEALYVLWAGANDYLQGQRNVSVPVENMLGAIATLSQQGAQYFLVANLPDLGQLPATRENGDASQLSALTRDHNQRLGERIQQRVAQHPDTHILLLDTFSLYDRALTHPNRFGLTNVTETCLAGFQICSNPDQFLFWDGIHPSTAGHQLVAEAAYNLLQQTQLLAR